MPKQAVVQTILGFIFAIIYGRPKCGKTVMLAAGFPCGKFITPAGGALSASHLGITLDTWEITTDTGFKEIADFIRAESQNYPAIIIDDFSLICDAEVARCQRAHSGFAAFDEFKNRTTMLRDVCRAAQCHVILVMHEQAPREVKKPGSTRFIHGGPLISGYQMVERLPAMTDMVVRVVHDDEAPGQWPFVLEAGPDPDYITGDRLGVLPSSFPMNLREVMLAAGYDIPRPEALAWMDEKVEAASKALIKEMAKDDGDVRPILAKMAKRLSGKVKDHRHIRWVLNDALHRAQLRLHKRNLLTDFVNSFE